MAPMRPWARRRWPIERPGIAIGRAGDEGRPTIRRQTPHAISSPMRQTEMAATSLAAVPPAQYGLSSSSRNAMKRARHTEAHSRMAKSSGGPTVACVSEAGCSSGASVQLRRWRHEWQL